jgi:hypothetical protein
VLNHLAYKLHFEPEQNRRRREAFLTGSAHLTLIRPNFVNTPLRSAAFIWYKQFTESSVWLAGRIL